MKKTIYLISGLGADERIFQLLDFGNYEVKLIKWIDPQKKETIQDYARRLIAQINTARPIILGVSFGGMIAVEIAKQINCEQIILISSAKTKREIPVLYRFIGQANLHKIVPIFFFKQANLLTYWFFGMQTRAERNLLKSILADTDGRFLKWAINALITWDNEYPVENLIHVHGSKDRILPMRNIASVDYKVRGGGHLMIYSRAEEVSGILSRVLKFNL